MFFTIRPGRRISISCLYKLKRVKLSIFLGGIMLTTSCNYGNRNPSHPEISYSSIRSGEALAKIHCQSCHAFPDPSLLDVKSWEKGVLPNMGPRLGIFSFKGQSYPSLRYDLFIPRGYYPAKSRIKPEDWQDIMNYYLATAPDSLPLQNRPFPIKNDLNSFAVFTPPVQYPDPTTCFIQVDTTTMPHTLLQSDVLTSKVVRFDRYLKRIDSFHADGPVLDIDLSNQQMIACDVGLLNPTNGRFGKLEVILKKGKNKMILNSRFLIDSLQRPVQVLAADLNIDGRMDYLVCEFGYLTGALTWYENRGNNRYSRHVLLPLPGAIKAYVNDYNHDGLPDLVVLFAQGEEGIFLFTNKGGGQFDEREIIRFPPVYGSSYFELDDFNQDGFPDILYTCGDNADFSSVLKPYHGLYIFLNDGHWNFSQKYFFPINGCYKAMARDFDGDGDLDIAAISFLPTMPDSRKKDLCILKIPAGLCSNRIVWRSRKPDAG